MMAHINNNTNVLANAISIPLTIFIKKSLEFVFPTFY